MGWSRWLLAKTADRELARRVSYLKEENKVLRARLPKQINVTPKERERLLRFGRHLGKAIHKVVTIVSPGTFLTSLRDEKRTGKRRRGKRGRPRTAQDLRELILKLARENDWGYRRIPDALLPKQLRTVTCVLVSGYP